MTEPGEDELERAERIRKLRSGGAKSRGKEIRDRRRERADDGEAASGGDADGDERAAGATDATGESDADGTDAGGEDAGSGVGPPTAVGSETDVLELATELPEDGSLFVVPVREDLRRAFNRVAEQLHLRYGFQYRSELDADRHVRPLALYLGVQALEDADVETVKELLASTDELDAPGGDDGG